MTRPTTARTVLPLALSVTAYSLAQSLAIPVLPQLESTFNTDTQTVAWVLTASLLTTAISTPLLGRIGDAYGKRRVLIVAVSLLLAGSLLCAVSPTIGTLIAARAIQGVGGGVVPLAFGIVRDHVHDHLSAALGFLSAMAGAGFGLGLIIGGPVLYVTSPQVALAPPAILAGAALALTLRWLPESPTITGAAVPVLRAGLLGATLLLLLLALNRTAMDGAITLWTLCTTGFAVALGTMWMRAELSSHANYIDVRALARPRLRAASTIAFIMGFSTFGLYSAFPRFVQTDPGEGFGFGASLTTSGLLLLPSAIGTLAVGLLLSVGKHRSSARTQLVIGISITAAAMGLLAVWHESVLVVIALIALQGIGFGLLNASLAHVVVSSVLPSEAGTTSGMNATLSTVGGSFGTVAVANLLAGDAQESSFQTTFGLLACTLAVAIVISLKLSRSAEPEPTNPEPALAM